MPVLIYMESAYRRADGTGVIRCEAMLPGDGQATISNGLKGDLLVLSMFIVLDFVWSKIKEDRTKRKAVSLTSAGN